MSSSPPPAETAQDEFDEALQTITGGGSGSRVDGDRLLPLLRAALGSGRGADLPSVLHRLLETAVDLLGADYGALHISGDFVAGSTSVSTDLPPDDLDAVEGALRSARLHDRLVDESVPIRIDDLLTEPAPRAGAASRLHVLGVPVRVGGTTVGSLCLARSAPAPFSASDGQLLRALGTAAAAALDHARLRAEADRHQEWAEAAVGTAAALLSGEAEKPYSILAARVRVLAAADLVWIVRSHGGSRPLEVVAAVGLDHRLTEGMELPRDWQLTQLVLGAGQPQLIASGDLGGGRERGQVAVGPLMIVPLLEENRAVGAVIVGRDSGGAPFSPFDLSRLAEFTEHATVALQLVDARADQQRALLLKERARIARDLHDTVIQQLFAAGLELRSIAAPLPPGPVVDRLNHSIALIDAGMAQIRSGVLALSPDAASDSVRSRILEIVRELSGQFIRPPQLTFDGPLDLVARGGLAEDVVAVVRESLTNVVRHAAATEAAVAITVRDGWLGIVVQDNGVGLQHAYQRSGLSNLAERAAAHGGSFAIDSSTGRTLATWSVPYDAAGRE
ncbi:MAG: Two-component system histidine kinase [Amnibacterium sp.]|nr:Two-component system histidine kinase [Amnibacterium sp.]